MFYTNPFIKSDDREYTLYLQIHTLHREKFFLRKSQLRRMNNLNIVRKNMSSYIFVYDVSLLYKKIFQKKVLKDKSEWFPSKSRVYTNKYYYIMLILVLNQQIFSVYKRDFKTPVC